MKREDRSETCKMQTIPRTVEGGEHWGRLMNLWYIKRPFKSAFDKSGGKTKQTKYQNLETIRHTEKEVNKRR